MNVVGSWAFIRFYDGTFIADTEVKQAAEDMLKNDLECRIDTMARMCKLTGFVREHESLSRGKFVETSMVLAIEHKKGEEYVKVVTRTGVNYYIG